MFFKEEKIKWNVLTSKNIKCRYCIIIVCWSQSCYFDFLLDQTAITSILLQFSSPRFLRDAKPQVGKFLQVYNFVCVGDFDFELEYHSTIFANIPDFTRPRKSFYFKTTHFIKYYKFLKLIINIKILNKICLVFIILFRTIYVYVSWLFGSI